MRLAYVALVIYSTLGGVLLDNAPDLGFDGARSSSYGGGLAFPSR